MDNSSPRILSAFFLMIVFILGTIGTEYHLVESNSDGLEILQDDVNDAEEDHLTLGDSENDETQILFSDEKHLLTLIYKGFSHRVFQFTAHSLLVVTPPPELI
jgi:hypothetical protein